MYYIGIDLGGTNTGIGIVNQNRKFLLKDEIPTSKHKSFNYVIKQIAIWILDIISKNNINKAHIKAIGIGTPGVYDENKGTLVFVNNFGWNNVPIREEFQRYFNLPIYVNNDANMAAIAESMCGAGKNANSSITLTLGTGIGSGIILNNKLYTGNHGVGAELGHIMYDINGLKCTCGNRGCWEQYASASALGRSAQKAAKKNPKTLMLKKVNNINDIDARILMEAIGEKDDIAQKVFEEYILYLGMGIISIINSFDPELIIIGGGLSKAGDILLNPLKAFIRKHVFFKELSYAKICIAELGNDAGILGAALYAESMN